MRRAAYVFDFALQSSAAATKGKPSLHFASGILLEPRMSLVVRLRGF